MDQLKQYTNALPHVYHACTCINLAILDRINDLASTNIAKDTCTQGLSYNDLEKVNPDIWRNTHM